MHIKNDENHKWKNAIKNILGAIGQLYVGTQQLEMLMQESGETTPTFAHEVFMFPNCFPEIAIKAHFHQPQPFLRSLEKPRQLSSLSRW